MRLTKFYITVSALILLTSCHEINNELCTTEQTYNTKYSQFKGLDVYNNIDDAISCSTKTQKPLFVIFSGYGYRRETSAQTIFKNRKIRKIVSKKFIPVVLYVDDGKKLDEIQVVNRNGKVHKLRTIGNVNSDYQIRKFKSNNQPLFAILDHNGERIIDQMGYDESQNKYYTMLTNGYKEYQVLKEK